MTDNETSQRIARRIMEASATYMDDETFAAFYSPLGLAPTAQWHTEDDHLVEYTTKRVRGGELAGMFAVFYFKPAGKGSRAGKRGSAARWERYKVERCKTRTEARERAVRFYREHSPVWAAKHPETTNREGSQ